VVAVPIELSALPADAVLAVDCGLAARLAERLAGGPGARLPASVPTHAERAVLDLLVLAALDGIGTVPEIGAALAPRLGSRPARVARPVAVELEISAGGIDGRATLILPARAVAATRGVPELPAGLDEVTLPASLRSGTSATLPADVAGARPGDVVPLDPPPGDVAVVALPGGTRIRGRLGEEGLAVEEVEMARIGGAGAELPVCLEVDLGSVAIPLRELARLERGGVLPLPLDRRGLVTLRLGERALARGELVDLDGEVGVRIVDVEAAP
jgi:type III secretion protein Q